METKAKDLKTKQWDHTNAETELKRLKQMNQTPEVEEKVKKQEEEVERLKKKMDRAQRESKIADKAYADSKPTALNKVKKALKKISRKNKRFKKEFQWQFPKDGGGFQSIVKIFAELDNQDGAQIGAAFAGNTIGAM